MLPRKKRIGKSLFTEVMRRGNTYQSPSFALKVLQSDKSKESKVAFTISKKTIKSAVERNYLKRRGQYVARSVYSQIEPSLLVLVTIKKNLSKTPFLQFKTELLGLMKHSGVIRN